MTEPTSSYDDRQAAAFRIAEQMGAVDCKAVPGEFARQGWVWRVTDSCVGPLAIIKMAAGGRRALRCELFGSDPAWTGSRWKVPTHIDRFSTAHMPMPDGAPPALAAVVYLPVEGNVLSWGEFLSLPEAIQAQFACDLADMASAFHRHHGNGRGWGIPPTALARTRAFSNTLTSFMGKLTANEDLSPHGRYLAEALAAHISVTESLVPARDAKPLVMLHNDLSIQNLVLDDDGRLIGVFDFANAGLGRPANEFRFLAHADWDLSVLARNRYIQARGYDKDVVGDTELWAEAALAALSGLAHRRGLTLPLAVERAERCLHVAEQLPRDCSAIVPGRLC